MRAARLTLAALLAFALAACGTTVSSINARPDKYYQQRVDLDGRIERRQDLPGEILLDCSAVAASWCAPRLRSTRSWATG